MSLESALEEERLGILKILEAAGNGRSQSASASPRRPAQNTSSLLLPDDPPPRKTSSSMILDDDDGAPLKPSSTINTGSLKNNRSLSTPSSHTLRPIKSASGGSSAKKYADYDDPTDPLASGNSKFYDMNALRSTLPSSFMTKREREEMERNSQRSKFSFWKRSQQSLSASNSRQASRSPSRDRSTSSNRGNSNLEKQLFSSNAALLAGAPSASNPLSPYKSSDLASSRRSSSSNPNNSYLENYMNDFSAIRTSSNSRRTSTSVPKTASDGGTNDEFAELYKSLGTSRRMMDEDDQEDVYSDDDETGSSSEDDSDSDDSKEEEPSADVSGLHSGIVTGKSETLLSAMEDERKSVESSKFRVKSLLDTEPLPGAVPPPSMAEYAAYKRRIIHPSTAFDNDILEDTPYTSDTEEILDARRAANLPLNISTIQSNITAKRMIRTMSRGKDLPSLTDPNAAIPKTYVLGTDLSPEATHALEWTIGTVLRDSNVLYMVCAYEDETLNDKSSSITPQQQEDDRLSAMKQLTSTTTKLLKKTRLQVHVIIEIVHCKSPRHLLTAVIDHVMPTMVIMGSRGRSALKGVLLGSFSNYIVERSSVPVMVARRKLHKTKHKDINVRLSNNLRASGGLSTAIVD